MRLIYKATFKPLRNRFCSHFSRILGRFWSQNLIQTGFWIHFICINAKSHFWQHSQRFVRFYLLLPLQIQLEFHVISAFWLHRYENCFGKRQWIGFYCFRGRFSAHFASKMGGVLPGKLGLETLPNPTWTPNVIRKRWGSYFRPILAQNGRSFGGEFGPDCAFYSNLD